ncbi:Unknown protein, partial [Striga hermonthica]
RLPRSRTGHDSIWVIVDRLTKSAHFLPVRTTMKASQYAELFVDEIVKLYGVPVEIVSNRDAKFTGQFWRTLHRAMGTRLEFSTTFHPQTDGQSERTIQYLEDILRAVVLDRSLTWESALPLVELTYNNSYHSSIKMAPFEALYGRKVRTPLYWDEVGERKIMGPEFIHRASETVEAIRKHIRFAQERQKVYADRERQEHVYAVGDHVFLKVSPMKGVIRFGKKGKLKPRYIGPFEILARVGNLAYRLALPPSLSGVHDVFHVSMLRRYVHDPGHVVDFGELQVERDLTYEEVPVAILDQK